MELLLLLLVLLIFCLSYPLIPYLSQNHDGFILFLPTLDTYGYDVIKKSLEGYPIISIAPVFEPVFDTFTFDSYQGGALAAKQFIESGVEKFGVIHGPPEKWEAELRKSGFYDTLEKESKKISWSFKGDYSFESGEMAFREIFDNKIISRLYLSLNRISSINK